ncbi:hypothetical protein R5R35_003146 [Gryllus longicercus]|uniref:Venom dipeptidyl peptidase 4 n=1 Tax=Gryllus longicercus TaxID=2509291 RepID=A0AAN9VYX9_9ORTH
MVARSSKGGGSGGVAGVAGPAAGKGAVGEARALLDSSEDEDEEDALGGRGGTAYFFGELMGTSHSYRRSVRAAMAACVVALLILALVIAGAVLLARRGPSSSRPGDAAATGRSVDAGDVLESRFAAQGFNGSWVDDTRLLFRDDAGRPMLFDATTRTSRALLKNHGLIPSSTIKLELSADHKYLLAVYNYSKLFRHTYLSQYDIIDLEKGERRTLQAAVETHAPGDDPRVLQLAIWAPTGNAIAFVYHNDIFYRASAAADAETVRLTSDGSFSTVYHGVPDWVYEEEVFSSNTAMWFSPDSSKLAYATFNDTRTRVMTIPYYGSPTVLEFQYPRAINLRYPKPGTPNPTVSLTVVQLGGDSPKSVKLAPPETLREPILSTVAWANDDEVAAIWMNRVQNRGELVVCTAMASQCTTMQSLHEEAGWLDLFVPPIFSKDGKRVVFVYPQNQSNDAGAYRHVTLIEREPKFDSLISLTSGKFVVTEILAWDEKTHLVYFLGTDESDPATLHLYSVSDNASTAPNQHTCISCQFKTRASGKSCLYNKASFSKECSFFMHSCSGPDVPEVSLYDKENKHLMIWEDNQEVRELLKDRVLPTIKQMRVDVPGGFRALVQLLLPPNMDTSGHTKYPLLVNVYGGPDSTQVTKRFNVDWSSYLTVNHSIIYAAIDGRGSGLKGNRMLFSGYRRLGSVEIDDQVNVTKYLQDTLSFIDKNRTAIWGWSYGGYSTGMALAKDKQGVFKCGIAVAPVTDWAYYDTIYTERYMGLPTQSDNLDGYVESELNNKYENFRNKMFFLVHGTLDDNVHYQQSMMLSKVLEHHDILFRQQSYPDEEHGLAGVRPHLYHSLENFLEECFKLK